MNKGLLIQRILRPYPQDSFVVDKSTAVVSFGDSLTSRVATIGINPSSAEFQEEGKPLTGDMRRLEDLDSLEIKHPNEIRESHAEKILEGCKNYFQTNNPYMDWFGNLQNNVLRNIGASYLNGDACHLDLVQWATDPVWGEISNSKIRTRLLNEDLPFLSDQLKAKNLELIFLGSSEVMNKLTGTGDVKVEVARIFEYRTTTGKTRSVKYYKGHSKNGQHVLGWSRTFSRQYISPENYSKSIEILNDFVTENWGSTN